MLLKVRWAETPSGARIGQNGIKQVLDGWAENADGITSAIDVESQTDRMHYSP